MADRESYLYQAKLAEQAERYDEMVQSMKNLAKLNTALTVEERNLLSVGYKNIIGSRRASWRVITAIESKVGDDETVKREVTKKYKKTIEGELKEICDDILKLLTDNLIPSCSDGTTDSTEALVFYHKMKADYYRYMAEFSVAEDRKDCAENSLAAYKEASKVSKEGLSSTHPIRLGLALNFSVFYYEILNDGQKAIDLAKSAFDDAVSGLNELGDDTYKDSTLILQLLRDNLTLWTTELGEDDDKPGPVEDVEAQ